MSEPDVSVRTMMRYLRKMDANAVDAAILAQADRLSACGEWITDEMVEQNITALNRLIDFSIEAPKAEVAPPKLLSGDEIMEILNIKPSPELGKIITALRDAQLSGKINTRDEAIEFISN
jgi:site-specific recombinase XerC